LNCPSVLANHTPINLLIHVIHSSGPTGVFISSVVHGDEILALKVRLFNIEP
jgi:hypothetical protein